MKLVIVESPTKAKTISKFLGKKEFKIKSSYGHVRDLPKKKMGVDIENDFAPEYIIPTAAEERVEELKDLAKKSEEVILATDEDREGEAISWHLIEALGLKKSAKRIAFHEITKSAIEKALQNPREINLDLVDAQQARRILDRLVGYELSPFLWKKIRRGLSAGRVQSVALRFIVEREREIEKFKSETFWTLPIKLKKEKDTKEKEFDASLLEKNGKKVEKTKTFKLFAGDYKVKKTIFDSAQIANKAMSDLKKSKLEIIDISEKETLRSPAAPFTTSSLQQSAINSLGWSAKSTMMHAQKLYEKGFITYMRTDSVNLSLESMLSAKRVIESEFGEKYSLPDPRFFKSRSKGAQEAHEAIRPSDPGKTPASLQKDLDAQQFKLYKLIWERMVASQMQPAVFDAVRVKIEAKHEKDTYLLSASGSSIKFDGYLKAYSGRKNTDENMLPPLKKEDSLEISEITSEEKSTTPPPRYNEAGLVKVLEENGIGRPSTYAPTISTIIERKYIDKNEEKRLFPLEIGMVVNDLLVEHFPQIVDTNFTAEIEEDFDKVAEGEKEWTKVVKKIYKPFHKNLASKTKEVKKEDFQEKLDRSCPECGGDLVVKFGRFGKFIACSNYPNCRYTEKTAEEKKEQDKIEKENDIPPCDLCGAPMAVKRGRYGTFLGCSNYPNCKNIRKIENKTGVKCPKCCKGDIVERKSKRGRLFYGCNSYPNCDFALWQKPTGEKCPQCQSLLTFAAKGKIKCSNKECKYEK